MALTGTIKVTPEDLIKKGLELQNIVSSFISQLDEVKNLVNATRNYWVGTAGDALRDEYTRLNAEVQETLKRLGEHPVNLQIMAGVYKKHDVDALQRAQALSGEILE